MSLDQLVPAPQALKTVLKDAEPVGKETLPLSVASNRILAQDAAALRTQPPFDASAMDGYAVRAGDVSTLPARLEITGTSRAGVPYGSRLADGTAVRIFTGAIVPERADTIIIQENTTREDNRVIIHGSTKPGRYIRKSGLDFSQGEVLLKTGQMLTPARLSLAASMNHPQLTVYTKPKVAILATGDELVMPGETTNEGQIIASNTFGLAATVHASGGQILDLGISADTSEALKKQTQ